MKKILVGVVAAVMSASVFAAPDKATQARIDALENRIAQLEAAFKDLEMVRYHDKIDTSMAIMTAIQNQDRHNVGHVIVKKKAEFKETSEAFSKCANEKLRENEYDFPLTRIFRLGGCYTSFLMRFESLEYAVRNSK